MSAPVFSRFNDDGSCLVVTYPDSVVIYGTQPFQQLVRTPAPPAAAPLRAATILDRSNLLLLQPAEGSNLWLYDDRTASTSAVLVDEPPRDAFVSRAGILVVFETFVLMLQLQPPHALLARVETARDGAACLYRGTLALALPVTGKVKLAEVAAGELANQREVRVHKSAAACVTLNERYLATCSVHGTLVRCVDLQTLEKLTFRRGADQARVWALALSPASRLAALSSNGTLHVFDLSARERSPLRRRYARDGMHVAHAKTLSRAPATLAWASEREILVARANDKICESFIFENNALVRGPHYAL